MLPGPATIPAIRIIHRPRRHVGFMIKQYQAVRVHFEVSALRRHPEEGKGLTVPGVGETGAARRDVAVAGARLVGADPEGVQLSLRQMEAELDRLAARRDGAVGPLPSHPVERLVAPERNAVGAG